MFRWWAYSASPRYAGNTDFEASPKRVSDSLAAIDAFFRDLPVKTGLPPDRVLFTLDGFRYPQAAAEGAMQTPASVTHKKTAHISGQYPHAVTTTDAAPSASAPTVTAPPGVPCVA